MPTEINGRKTFCNPMSMPECPRGVEGSMRYTGEEKRDYRSISDPSVLYYKGKWYLYPSYGIAWVSEDFARWKHIECTAYEAPGYSPSVIEHRGKFCMAVHSRGYFLGDSPTGPFRHLGGFIRPDGSEFDATDPALFKDDDGRLYLYWHEGRMDPKRGVPTTLSCGAELDPDDPRKLLCDPIVLNAFDPDHVWERFGQDNQDVLFGWIEGQWMLKHNGRYYLVYAACGTQFSTYAMGAYYSDAGPLGPFIYQKNNPVTANREGLIKGAGHGCIVHGPDNTLWAFYTTTLCYTHCYERRIGMDYIDVDENGELYCPRITDTPQYAPGQVEDPLRGGDTGLLPLTFGQRSAHKATSHTEGRDPLYALDESMLTWWQPRADDPQKQLTVQLRAAYVIEAARLIWREVGLDYDNGVVPGPFRYKIEACADSEETQWVTVLDMTANNEDNNIDYQTFPPFSAEVVRLTITGAPSGIQPGVISFTVFGKRDTEKAVRESP